MRGNLRSNEYSETVKVAEAADPLKGLLRDKGAAEVERSIRIIQRKMTRVQEAMVALVKDQRASALEASCDFMDLYLATYKINDGSGPGNDKAGIVFEELKMASVLEWRAKHVFANQFSLGRASRLHPFDTKHPSHILVSDYVMQVSPSYYKVLAAFETARLTLNYALKALFKIALDLHKIQAEAEGLPRGVFDKATARLSAQLINQVDVTGELEWILQGLYFEM